MKENKVMRKLYHPLWIHLPAGALIVTGIVSVIQMLPLPARVPIHFDMAGQPNGYGSPWLGAGLMLGLSVFYLAVSALGDELWARHERRKRFNWLSLFDEAIIGFLVGMNIAALQVAREPQPVFHFPSTIVLPLMGLAVLAAIILEFKRPHVPSEEAVATEDATALKEKLTERFRAGQPATYWEAQDPWWMNLVIFATSILLLIGAVSTWRVILWSAVIQLVIALGIFVLYGGLRITVTQQKLSVRLGIFGLRLLILKKEQIAEIEVHQFSPLADFGGYGIRMNRQMVAFYFRGNRGVKVTTDRGKRYLLGSDHPDRLAAVLRAQQESGTGGTPVPES